MSRKRKTKKEKVISHLRRQALLQKKSQESSGSPINYNIQGIDINQAEKKDKAISTYKQPITKRVTKDYSYVLSDVKRTITITLFILLVNFTLFFLLSKNILNMKFLGL